MKKPAASFKVFSECPVIAVARARASISPAAHSSSHVIPFGSAERAAGRTK
jgi:hypothetical protein